MTRPTALATRLPYGRPRPGLREAMRDLAAAQAAVHDTTAEDPDHPRLPAMHAWQAHAQAAVTTAQETPR